MNYACSQCGGRQEEERSCKHCGYEFVHDLRNRRSRDYLLQIERDIKAKRDRRIKYVGVGVGSALIGAVLVTEAFARIPNVVLWSAIAGVTFGIIVGGERLLAGRKRFPYLEE